jgi:hypothetical protein
LAEYGIRHSATSPRYLQANGQAERAVQTCKGFIKKNNTNIWEDTMVYNSTPLSNGWTPSELIFGRILRTNFPVSEKLLQPKMIDPEEVMRKEQEIKERQKMDFDKRHRVKTLCPLKTGDKV